MSPAESRPKVAACDTIKLNYCRLQDQGPALVVFKVGIRIVSFSVIGIWSVCMFLKSQLRADVDIAKIKALYYKDKSG